jgi:hypothetical protein
VQELEGDDDLLLTPQNQLRIEEKEKERIGNTKRV